MSSQVTMPRNTVQKIGAVQSSGLADPKVGEPSVKQRFMDEYRRNRTRSLSKPEGGPRSSDSTGPLDQTDATPSHKYSESARANWAAHPESWIKDKQKWQGGKKLRDQGSKSSDPIVRKLNSEKISYYFYHGDLAAGIKQVRNPQRLFEAIMAVHKNDAAWTAMKLMEQMAVELDAKQKAYWRPRQGDPNKPVLPRGQAANNKKHETSINNMQEAFDKELQVTGKAPSRDKLVVLAKCSATSASAFLKRKSVSTKDPSYIEQILSSYDQENKNCSMNIGSLVDTDSLNVEDRFFRNNIDMSNVPDNALTIDGYLTWCEGRNCLKPDLDVLALALQKEKIGRSRAVAASAAAAVVAAAKTSNSAAPFNLIPLYNVPDRDLVDFDTYCLFDKTCLRKLTGFGVPKEEFELLLTEERAKRQAEACRRDGPPVPHQINFSNVPDKALTLSSHYDWSDVSTKLNIDINDLMPTLKRERSRRRVREARAALTERWEPTPVACRYCGEHGYFLENQNRKKVFVDVAPGIFHTDKFQHGVHVPHNLHCKELKRRS